MLGAGLGGLEQVFLDDQAILQPWAEAQGGVCVGVARRSAAILDPAADRAVTLETMRAAADWDPLSLLAARRLVSRAKPDLILSHGRRAARLFQRATGPGQRLAVCIHKPGFDLERRRTDYICVSRHLAEHVLAAGAAPERVHVVHNAVAIPQAPARPFADPSRPPRIVAAGRLHAKKGFDVLVAALALLRDEGVDFRCDIAGEGEMRPALEAQILALRLQDRVRLVGWSRDVPGFLASGDVFAFPSHQEGFPLVLLQAMAAGLPVAASAIPGPLEMIDEGFTGRFAADGDPQALAQTLSRLVADAEDSRRLGEAARLEVATRYSAEQIRADLTGVIRTILDRPLAG